MDEETGGRRGVSGRRGLHKWSADSGRPERGAGGPWLLVIPGWFSLLIGHIYFWSPCISASPSDSITLQGEPHQLISSLSVVKSLNGVQLFATPWIVALKAPLSFPVSQNLLRFMCIELVGPSNQFILCCLLLLLPSIFLSIRIFSSELALRIRWPEYWSFTFSISPSNE